MTSVATLTGLAIAGTRLVVVKRRVVTGTVLGDRERHEAHSRAVEATTAEARWLAAARVPGVVHLQRVSDDTQFTSHLAGTATMRTLAPLLQRQPAAAAALIADLAETVESIHQLGLVHGRIDLSHAIVGGRDRDRVRLCSPSGTATGQDADVAALGWLAAGLVAVWGLTPRGWEAVIDEITGEPARLRPRQVAKRFRDLARRRRLPGRWPAVFSERIRRG